MKSMDIFIANVPFDDEDKDKIRPALVVKVTPQHVRVFKITYQYKNKSPKIKEFYYRIEEWKEAGLKKTSYVDTHKTYQLPLQKVMSYSPIGKLSGLDTLQLFSFIKNRISRQ